MTPKQTRRCEESHSIWVLPALVLVTIAAVGLLYLRGDLNSVLCDGPCPAEYVTAPEGLAVAKPAAATASTFGAGQISAAAVQAAIADSLASPDLGRRSSFYAIDARDGTVLAKSGTGALTPASTTKVLTAFAALNELGSTTRFETKVVRQGNQLVLVGGGDPYLMTKAVKGSAVAKANLTDLAKQAAKSVGEQPVEVGYDASLFTGPAASPGWEVSYLPGGVVAPVSALWVDRGRVGSARSADPAAAAAAVFVGQLRAAGVKVVGTPVQTTARAGGKQVAVAKSAPVNRIVERLLTDSDNEVAEVMLRQAAIAAGEPASFEGGAATVKKSLTAAKVSTSGLVLYDGSGLSRKNRISAQTLVGVLSASAKSPATSAVLSGLPVGGFTGTLDDRFGGETAAKGLVRAKTGTLTGVHSLAGLATLSGGRPIAFALMADQTEQVNPFVVQAAIDRVAADLVACACKGSG